jgi:hypothetical protein
LYRTDPFVIYVENQTVSSPRRLFRTELSQYKLGAVKRFHSTEQSLYDTHGEKSREKRPRFIPPNNLAIWGLYTTGAKELSPSKCKGDADDELLLREPSNQDTTLTLLRSSHYVTFKHGGLKFKRHFQTFKLHLSPTVSRLHA